MAGLPRRPVLSAFTATATEEVRRDIARLLRLNDPEVVAAGFDRPNLFFDVRRPQNKLAALRAFLEERPGRSGIVCCATRSGVEKVCQALNESGFSVARYHAGLSDEERRRNQTDFQFDRKLIMVAANAFGMGIDKSNVSFVVHCNMPKSLEAYYQEAGRPGRGACGVHPAVCARRRNDGEVPDRAQRGRKWGSGDRRIRELGLDELSVFGLLKGISRETVNGYADRLVELGYLFVEQAHTTLRPTEKASEVLFHGAKVTMLTRLDFQEKRPRRRSDNQRSGRAAAVDDGLLAALKAVRTRLAREEEVPAYIIFSNAALADMAAKAPRTIDQFLQVSGVGEVKAERYGSDFLRAISEYTERGNKDAGAE